MLKCEKNESRFYIFEAKLSPLDLEVLNRITFLDFDYKMEIMISQTTAQKETNPKAIFIDPNNVNILKDYVHEKFGTPKFFSILFSAINEPFYNHRWTFAHLKVTH